MVRRIGILGSTGSIGTQTLEVIRELNASAGAAGGAEYRVCVLTCGSNRELLLKQILEFLPETVCIASGDDAKWLGRELTSAGGGIASGAKILYGDDGLEEAASVPLDLLVTAIVGMRGLKPTVKAIRAGTDIALANKETLVAAGEAVMSLAAEMNVRILPVDSEHSAIFQCLESSFAGGRSSVDELILTASGGPFRTYSARELESVKPSDALRHPTWKMGGKITVDCATMMNKGLEVIEAMHLFGLPPEKIGVNVHPQSIVHSMVRFCDGSVIAQLGNPDMKVPIQLALTYPARRPSRTPVLDLTAIGSLTFEKPRTDVFPCLGTAYEAARRGGAYGAVLNGADEAAVELFLKGKIGFNAIPKAVEAAMEAYDGPARAEGGADDGVRLAVEADRLARDYVRRISEWL